MSGVAPERVRTVYLGCGSEWQTITSDRRAAARAWLGVPLERPLAAFVGGFGHDSRKGFDTLWTAWKSLCARPEWDADLIVAGGGRALPHWRETIERSGLGSRVRMLGFCDRVPDVLAAADVLVSPVRYESYGLNVQEAICCGVPAIVSRSAGVAERYPVELDELLLPDAENADDLAERMLHWRSRIDEFKRRIAPFGATLRRMDLAGHGGADGRGCREYRAIIKCGRFMRSQWCRGGARVSGGGLEMKRVAGARDEASLLEVPELDSTLPAAPAELPLKPVLTIESARRWVGLDLRDLWAHRDLLYFLILRDVKVRYKQTALGIAWAVLQPLLTMVIFTAIFGRLAGVPSDGEPYPIFVFAGLLPWNFFNQAVTNSSNSLVGNAGLITKVYFPRLVIPTAAVGAGLVDFAIASLILFAMAFHYGVSFGPDYADDAAVGASNDAVCDSRRHVDVRAQCQISRRALRASIHSANLDVCDAHHLPGHVHPGALALADRAQSIERHYSRLSLCDLCTSVRLECDGPLCRDHVPRAHLCGLCVSPHGA